MKLQSKVIILLSVFLLYSLVYKSEITFAQCSWNQCDSWTCCDFSDCGGWDCDKEGNCWWTTVTCMSCSTCSSCYTVYNNGAACSAGACPGTCSGGSCYASSYLISSTPTPPGDGTTACCPSSAYCVYGYACYSSGYSTCIGNIIASCNNGNLGAITCSYGCSNNQCLPGSATNLLINGQSSPAPIAVGDNIITSWTDPSGWQSYWHREGLIRKLSNGATLLSDFNMPLSPYPAIPTAGAQAGDYQLEMRICNSGSTLCSSWAALQFKLQPGAVTNLLVNSQANPAPIPIGQNIQLSWTDPSWQSSWHREAEIWKDGQLLVPSTTVSSPQTIPTTGSPAGAYTIKVKVCDSAGICGNQAQIQVALLQSGPQASNVVVNPSTVIVGQNPTIAFGWTDPAEFGQ